MEQDPFAQYAVAPPPPPKTADPFAAYAVKAEPTPSPAAAAPAQPASMWDSVYNFLTTPQAPEITSPAAQQHPWATAAYNTFVRPASSVVGGALTGITSAVGAPLVQAFPKAAGTAMGALGIGGAAQVPGDIGEISREGFTPENTMSLIEHGTMAAAAVPGAALASGKYVPKPKVRPSAAPKILSSDPNAGTPAAALAAKQGGTNVLPPKGMEFDEFGVLQPISRPLSAEAQANTVAPIAPVARSGQVVQPALFDDMAAKTISPDVELPPANIVDDVARTKPASVAMAEKIATVKGDEIPVARPIEQRKLVEDSMARRMPQEQRDDFLKVIDENDGFQAQRRDVQPVERTKGIARYLEVEKEKLAPGSIRNAEETTAVANALATVNDKIGALTQKIAADKAAGVDNVMDSAMLVKHRMEQAVLTSNYLGIRAEQGRALNMHKQLAQIIESHDIDMIRKALKSPGVRDMDPETFAKEWAKLGTDQEKLDWIRSHGQMSFLDKAKAVFYANILSGLKTTERNVLGTMSNAIFRAASDVPAVGWDILESKALSRPRTKYMSELPAQLEGALIGWNQGLKNGLFAMKHGYSPRQLSAFDVPRPELGPLGVGKFTLGKTPAANPFNYPGRFLEAQDAVMFEPVYNKELYGRLFAKAESAGLKGDARNRQVAEWRLAPPKDVKDAAEKAALQTLYREDPEYIAKWVMDGTKRIPGLGFLMPFVKIPANIMRQSVEAMPGGAFLTRQGRAALGAGGRERAEAVGRMVAGTSALGLLAYWAAMGKVSGAGPRDATKRAALMETGWQPNSVKFGDKWINYQIPFQSIAIPLSAVANAFEIYREKGELPDPGHLLMSVGGSALDQSFFSGVSDFNAALQDPDRSATRYTSRMAQSAVPFSGMSRNVAQAVDPVVREADTVAESVQSIVPGMSQGVSPKLDRFGAPVERPGGPLQRGFGPVTISSESQDPLIKELSRLKISSIGLPPKSLDPTKNPPMPKIELTTEERQQIDKAVRVALERLTSNPGWQQIPDEAARDMVARTVQQVRTGVIQQIRAKRRQQ